MVATETATKAESWCMAGTGTVEPTRRADPRRIQRAPRDVRWARAAAWRDASPEQLAAIGRGDR